MYSYENRLSINFKIPLKLVNMDQPKQNMVNGRFQMLELINDGSHGKVYKGYDIVMKTDVAIKCDYHSNPAVMMREAQMLEKLADVDGIPQIFWHGFYSEQYVIVMQLMGKDFREIMSEVTMTVTDVMKLAVQVIGIFKNIHSRGLIHKDCKLENIMMGCGKDKNKVYLVDFGLAEKFIINGEHIPMAKVRLRTGAPVFASLNNHKKRRQSRRDDLQSIGYVFLAMLKDGYDDLPWDAVTDGRQATFKDIYAKKASLGPKELFDGFPKAFTQFMAYAMQLNYKDQPDYEYLQGLFRLEIWRAGHTNDVLSADFDFNG